MPSLVFIHTALLVDGNIAIYVELCTDRILKPDWLNIWTSEVEKTRSVGITTWVGCVVWTGTVISVDVGDSVGVDVFVHDTKRANRKNVVARWWSVFTTGSLLLILYSCIEYTACLSWVLQFYFHKAPDDMRYLLVTGYEIIPLWRNQPQAKKIVWKRGVSY